MVSVSFSTLPMFASLQIEALDICEQSIVLHAISTTTSVPCPLCAAQATSVHSTYTRTLADLPWSGWAVRLRLRVRRFLVLQELPEPALDIGATARQGL